MRFVDEARVRVVSGRGGDGCVSFRREKYVPKGGPNGGDGGRGGDVILVATRRRTTLSELRGRSLWRAGDAERGRGKDQTGADGVPARVDVPVGTRVLDESGELLVDLVEHGQEWVAASGGSGGKGNTRFKSSTNQAPRAFTPGGDPEDRWLKLELRLLADVGLVGFPNAGKSTLVARVSAARPKVADYPFTTLVPQLGVVDMGLEGSFVMADIPGLIQGASAGAGLGHRFLRHVGRTRLLLHLVSLGEHDGPDPVGRWRTVRAELEAFDAKEGTALARLPERIVLTKVDLVTDDRCEAVRAEIQAAASPSELAVDVVSSATGRGLDGLLRATWTALQVAGAGGKELDPGRDRE